MKYESNQAAVMVIIKKDVLGESILLTKRSASMRLHSGEIAFPGGRRDREDGDLYATALRETSEEVGIDECQLRFVQALGASHSKTRIHVFPFVAMVDVKPTLTLSEDEIESAFWAPISVFKNDKRIRTDHFSVGGVKYWSPAYDYQGHIIWGLTARIIVDLLASVYDVTIKK